jgi:predicted RecA/RadA family phage recombinase
MKNYVQKGDVLTFTASGPVTAGAGILQGDLFGVAATDAATGEQFEAALTGVFELPKVGAAVTQGARAYWSAGDSSVTGVATDNTLIGAFAEDAGGAATIARVRLNGVA